jgi:hypothetical protein
MMVTTLMLTDLLARSGRRMTTTVDLRMTLQLTDFLVWSEIIK